MNLLILEYVSGGGYTDQKLSSSILSEGYGMLRSIIFDCKTAGHNVTTLLDSRLKEFNPPNKADRTVFVSSPNMFLSKLKEQANVADAVYVIAPESGQVLESLVESVEDSGGTSLNCEAEAIRQVSNKMTAYRILEKLGLKAPETVLLDIHEKTDNINRETKEIGYPLVFKPQDGVGCGGLSIVKNKGDIVGAIKKVTQESNSRQFIAQKIVRGEAASACVISTGKKAVAVSLNRQFVSLASPDEESQYQGGTVPFKHIQEKTALSAAKTVVEGVAGLKGYVGVDMILTEDGPVLLEVNPRLTTSYVGLRRVAFFNPAETIIDATIRRKPPTDVQIRGYCYFSKVEVASRLQIFKETYKLEGVVSPPFPINTNRPNYALIAASSTSPEGAETAFRQTKKRLLNIYGGD